MVHTLNNIKMIFLEVLLTNLLALIINLARELIFTEEKMLFTDLLKQNVKEYDYCKKNDKKAF